MLLAPADSAEYIQRAGRVTCEWPDSVVANPGMLDCGQNCRDCLRTELCVHIVFAHRLGSAYAGPMANENVDTQRVDDIFSAGATLLEFLLYLPSEHTLLEIPS